MAPLTTPKWPTLAYQQDSVLTRRSLLFQVFGDIRSILAWIPASCSGGLMAQLKGEKFMVVPTTADGLTAEVSALRLLHGKDGVSFHTFTLPEDRCVPLLVKNLGRV